MHKIIAATALIAMTSTAHASASANGPIQQIRLSSGGLAEITRSAAIGKDGQLQLDVPIDQVDDILKSLVLDGKSVSVGGLSLTGPQPMEDSFRGLPFGAGALSSVPALLGAIQGTAVSVTSNGKTVQGKVLGVEERIGPDEQRQFLLSVLTARASVETLALAQDAAVAIEDEALRAKLAAAADAIGRAANNRSRAINVKVQGPAGQDVKLSYVVAAPIWKTAYRVVTGEGGKARLQAWTVLENASGEDWKNVKVTLTSAQPVTLSQRLHERYWRDRHDVPIDTATRDVPDADSGNLGERERAAQAAADQLRRSAQQRAARAMPMAEFAAAAPAPAPEPAAMAGMGMAAPGQAAAATESDLSVTFELPGRYDLANGDTLSVPIVDADIDASLVSLYRAGSRSSHPVAAVMLRNGTGASLPPGILTIYDARSGYAGDARLAGLPDGDTRLASFATDHKVTVTQDQKPTEQITDIKAVDGMLQVSQKRRLATTYTVSGALDGGRTVVIEHPVRSGWTFESKQADGRTATHHRLKTEVPARQEKTLTAVDEQIQQLRYGLTDMNADALTRWSASAADPALAKKLGQLSAARARQADAERGLQRIDEELEQLSGEQGRIRGNLSSVPEGSDLGKRYLKQLEDSENAYAALTAKRQAARAALDKQEADARQLLRAF